jgi:membrane-bound lytic murein transglycosylase D
MPRLTTAVLALAALLPALGAPLLPATAGAAEPFPRPAGLEDNVRFWTRIYSEIDSSAGLIHDNRNMSVVYEVVRFPSGLSRHSQEREIEKAKRKYATALRQLARGRRSGLTAEQKSVLAHWPAKVTGATLATAAENVRFQRGQADRFEAGLGRAGAWREHIEQVLGAYGLPPELSALPHVESSFTPSAYSSVGAAGMWQFTRSTGRLFMQVDDVVDERLDPHMATVAAAKLLKFNYEKLGTWPLAITAYNHGTAGMAQAVRKVGTTEIATIAAKYDGRTFGFASRNFYSEFLAALDVDRNAERFFGPIHTDRPEKVDKVKLDHFYAPASLERAFGVDVATLRRLNPALRPAVWNGSKFVPRDFELALPHGSLKLSSSEVLAAIPPRERKAEQHRDRFYKVNRGDTLSGIARRHGVRERELVAVNNLRSRHQIRVGQVLVLPDHAAGGEVTVASSAAPSDGVYRVRRGDALGSIAKRFGVSETALVAENGLPNRNRIYVGQRLRIPGARTVAAAATPAPKAIAEAPPKVAPAASGPPATPAIATTPVATSSAVAEAEVSPAPTPEPVPKIAAAEPAAESAAPNTPPPDPSDYAVHADGRVTVQAAETIGHYAEWLELKSSQLRRINGLRFDAPVAIGRKAKMDFSRVTPETFERRRLAYHHSLQAEYFAAFEVIGTRTHTLRSGDSLWYLAERKYAVPVWLIRQYNPDLDFSSLPVGTRMIIPEVGERSS